MRPIRVRSLAVVAAVAVCSSAHAGGFPALNVQWTLDGNLVYDELPMGSPNGQGGYRYVGSHSVGMVSMTYDLIGIPDPRVSGGFTLENFSMQTVEVELLVTLPISPSVPAPSSLTGSVAVGMTADMDGGTLAALPGEPFWQGLIDGAAAPGTDLLAGLSIVQASPGGSAPGENAGFLQIPGPEALNDIGILVKFSLTAGEQMSFTSVFNVVPAPGGLAVLGFALVVRRRRRRAG